MPSDPAGSNLGRIRIVTPSVHLIRNSALPFSGNDGMLWAGRGTSIGVSGGATFAYPVGRATVRLSLVPIVARSENRSFQILPGAEPGRSDFSSPWHTGSESADLPIRFGSVPFTTLDPGESMIALDLPAVTIGAGSQSRWWGPGIRNALVLSNNAGGFPHVFAGTQTPITTPVGAVGLLLVAGAVTESRFFDSDASNDHQSLSGALLTLRPGRFTNLSLGFARLVTRPIDSGAAFLPKAFDAITHWEPLAARHDTTAAGSMQQTGDQLMSVFARWVFPESGFEAYVEWARMEAPRSLRDFATAPQHTQGYTLGVQWARRLAIPASLRLQSEFTYLEQTATFAERPPPSFYTGRATVHGFTHRGQVLGAMIGPGASSQWLAADLLWPAWQAGAFVGRVRTENDVMYRLVRPSPARHDVTLYGGVRGGLLHRLGDVAAELTVGRRHNYLFQNDGYNPGDRVRAIDVRNVTLELTVTPR